MGKIQQQGDFLVNAVVGLIRSEVLFQITHHLGRRYKANSGRNIWFFKELFDRRDSLVWIYFRIFAVERDSLRALCVAFSIGLNIDWGE